MSQPGAALKIAYTAQNCGIDLAEDVGEAIHVKYTLQGLQGAGHTVDYITLDERAVKIIADSSRPGEVRYISQGISASRLFNLFESGTRRAQGSLRLPYLAAFDSFRFYNALLRALPAYDLCHEHNGLLSVGSAQACRRLNKPYVLTLAADPFIEMKLDNQPLGGARARLAARAARFTYQTADRIICVSEPARQHLADTWQVDPGKISVLPNGVDVDCFKPGGDSRPLRRSFGLDSEPVVMFVGSFMLWHGIEDLVDSFAQVLHAEPSARLVLVGDGPARPAVERKIYDLDMQHAVRITGYIPHARVPEILSVADVVAVPYPRLPTELWFSPLKLYEYMAAGKAIVASRAGQIAEVITDGHNGRLVEPGDLASFARSILELLADAEARIRLGDNARRQAVSRHSWKQYAHRLEEIYRSVLTAHAR